MSNKKQLEIIEVPIINLKVSAYNPRKWSKGSLEQLKESISKFGIVDPLIANVATV